MRVFGFTILRNGRKYDYPFRESLHSLTGLCEKVYLALGDSSDGTEQDLAFPHLVILPTIWDENLRKSGLILSQQTNLALEALRREERTGWGIYLQADEVLDAHDYPQILADLASAEAAGCDCVSFRYLHFWQSYSRLAIAPRWYPQEIRAVRLESAIASYGDAQSFTPIGKRFESEVPVYHYGHVREATAYERKKKDFHRWWHSDAEIAAVEAAGAKKERSETTLAYLGPHPAVMDHRRNPQPLPRRDLLVYGNPNDYSAAFRESILAHLRWTKNLADLQRSDPAQSVALDPLPFPFRWLAGRKFASAVPLGMGSKLARPWTKEFRAILQFSEKGVGVKQKAASSSAFPPA